jgi:hypothetical protein
VFEQLSVAYHAREELLRVVFQLVLDAVFRSSVHGSASRELL